MKSIIIINFFTKITVFVQVYNENNPKPVKIHSLQLDILRKKIHREVLEVAKSVRFLLKNDNNVRKR